MEGAGWGLVRSQPVPAACCIVSLSPAASLFDCLHDDGVLCKASCRQGSPTRPPHMADSCLDTADQLHHHPSSTPNLNHCTHLLGTMAAITAGGQILLSSQEHHSHLQHPTHPTPQHLAVDVEPSLARGQPQLLLLQADLQGLQPLGDRKRDSAIVLNCLDAFKTAGMLCCCDCCNCSTRYVSIGIGIISTDLIPSSIWSRPAESALSE